MVKICTPGKDDTDIFEIEKAQGTMWRQGLFIQMRKMASQGECRQGFSLWKANTSKDRK